MLTQLYQYTPDTAVSYVNDDLAQLISAINDLTSGSTDVTAYARLAGRAGGQVLYLDTASGATTGVISSTAHATKGSWYLNAAKTIVVDEANTRFGIGSAPGVALDVSGSGAVARINGTTTETQMHFVSGGRTWMLRFAGTNPQFRIRDATGATEPFLIGVGAQNNAVLISGATAANQTALFLTEGSPAVQRHVQWKAGNTLTASDKVMVLV